MSENNLDLYLVNMPFGCYYSPSIGLSLLKPAAERTGLKTSILYANLIFADYMGLDEFIKFNKIAQSFRLFAENVFQPYAGYKSFKDIDEIIEFFSHGPNSFYDYSSRLAGYKPCLEKIWGFMDDYLEDIATRIISRSPKAVGCTYTLQQCNANLAILKKIKEISPDTVTFIGGSSCSIHAGQALVDHMDQIDYAFTGESDDVFGDAVSLMIKRDDKALREGHPWVIIKGGTASSHGMADMDKVEYPDFDDYFDTLEELGLGHNKDRVILPVEGSRGCWWGCKKKCNFCGLNNSRDTLNYREKSTKRMADELSYLSDKYGLKKFIFTDLIMSRNHIKDLPNLISGRDYEMRIEVKTNMTFDELKELRKAGFLWLQPGIESVNDDILTHINKGCRAIGQIEFLKYCKWLGIKIFWNILLGFPGEDAKWYFDLADTIPYITHLELPSGGVFNYQKKSYFTEVAKDYGVDLVIESFYPYLFGEDQEFLEAFAEYFEDPKRDISYSQRLLQENVKWIQAVRSGADLIYSSQEDYMEIFDTRPVAEEEIIILCEPEKMICEKSIHVTKADTVIKELIDMGYEDDKIQKAMDKLIDLKLIIRMRGEILFLALPRDYESNNPHREFFTDFTEKS